MSRARDLADSADKDIAGTLTLDGLDVAGNVSVDSGTIKLDGNYPTGTGNVAFGDAAMNGSISGNYNTALGDYSMQPMTSGASNTGVGGSALRFVTSGSYNAAVGHQSLHSNTTASNNVAVGYQAGYSKTTGDPITAVGHQALTSVTTGAYSTAVGRNAGDSVTTGNHNTLMGNFTGADITTGANNTAIGSESLRSNTTASNNTAVGYQAGYHITTGSYSTFIGRNAGTNTTGGENTFIGSSAGNLVTTGQKNTILGKFDGNNGGLDIRTSSNYIVLSDGDGNPRGIFDNNGYFGVGRDPSYKLDVLNSAADVVTARFEANTGTGTTEYGIYVNLANDPNDTSRYFMEGAGNGTARFRVLSNGNVVNTNNSYGSLSDEKLKENIVDASSQWDDIKALTVRKYSMKADNLDAPNMIGVIAQEVEAAGMGGLVFETQDKDDDFNDLGTVTKQVNYSILYMKAVKALQEAMERIETLEAKVTALENA